MTDLAPIIDDRERYKAFSKLMTGYTPSSDFDKRLLLGDQRKLGNEGVRKTVAILFRLFLPSICPEVHLG